MKKKQIKEKAATVKAKAKGMKEKIKAKVKGGKCAALAVAILSLASLLGCMDTNPASRQNAATYGDIVVKIGDGAASNSVSIVIGDGVVASADSSGSTETQSATPTQTTDVKPDIDVEVPVSKGGSAQSVGSTLGDAAAGFVKGLTEDGAASSTTNNSAAK